MTSVADQLGRLLARPIAHRGLHACDGDGPVENTMAAAQAAIVRGYGIECDVQLSRDGQAMVFHDDDLARLTGDPRPFRACDAAELSVLRLRDGSPIPTLAAFLAAIDGRAPLVVEIKSVGDGDMRLADAVLARTATYRGTVAIESFDPAVVAHCRNAACPIGLVGPSRTPVDPATLPRCDFLSWDVAKIAAAAVDYPGMPLSTWTVRTAAHRAAAKAAHAQIVFEGFNPAAVA